MKWVQNHLKFQKITPKAKNEQNRAGDKCGQSQVNKHTEIIAETKEQRKTHFKVPSYHLLLVALELQLS